MSGLAKCCGDGCDHALCIEQKRLLAAVEDRDAAIRAWDRASVDWQRGVAPAHLLHEDESRLRALARGEQ